MCFYTLFVSLWAPLFSNPSGSETKLVPSIALY